MTPEEIEQRIREEHPQFVVHEEGVEVIVSPETDPDRYESMIQERVEWRIAQQERDETRTAAQDELAAAKPVYQKLKTGSATANETQRFLALIGKHVYRLVGDDAEE